jgi:GMP synthase-like glutamine amidotransferase
VAKVLVLKHVASEGPGTLKEGFEKAGAEVEELNLYEEKGFPKVGDYSVLVSMGGPMNVYEDNKFPFLKKETDFLRDAIEEGKPVLGICLGAQLIARACGAKVAKAKVEEIGWSPVHITTDGRVDEMFWDFPSQLQVFQWHGDTFEVPEGGSLLFKAPLCKNQAFRYHNAYALQFHLEVNEELLSDWFEDSPKLENIMEEYKKREEGLRKMVDTICERLLKLGGF